MGVSAARVLCLVLTLWTIAGCSLDGKGPADDGEILTSEACASPAGTPMKVKVADVLASPELYSGKFLSLEGYYCDGFELSALYDAAGCHIPPRGGLWLEGISPFYQHNGNKVVVTGIFDRRLRGHLDQWPAGLCTTSFSEAE